MADFRPLAVSSTMKASERRVDHAGRRGVRHKPHDRVRLLGSQSLSLGSTDSPALGCARRWSSVLDADFTPISPLSWLTICWT